MASPFVDHVKLYLTAGKGGAGIVSWRREKFVNNGGPDGGDGGNGGSIVLKGNRQLWTLLDLKYRKFIKAESGAPGQGARKKGKTASDTILEVPLGTVAKRADTDEIIGEIGNEGDTLVVAKGGMGGLGNWHFRSSTNQTPDHAQPGTPGEEIAIILELKVLADVGLVGFPNAGKSTLLSVLTAAKPKIADYPFTTLVPNLGIVRYHDTGSFVMADIPGIISGAHKGKGLGLQFLRHIERNSVLLFLIPADAEDHDKELKTLLRELKKYNPELLLKEKVLAITKCDLVSEEEKDAIAAKFPKRRPVMISSATGVGLDELKDRLWEKLGKKD